MPVISIDFDEIIKLNEIVIRETSGDLGILNLHNIQNCSDMVLQVIYGQELHPGLFRKAAVLMHCISTSHGFLDGNKRTALLTLAEFLDRNGFTFQPDDNVINISLETAMNKINLVDLENWIHRCSRPKF